MTGKLILVGRVSGGFGVRGEIRIATYTEDPLSLLRYRTLLREDGSPALTLQTARATKDGLVGRAAEVDVKEAADALRGLRLYVPRELLPAIEDEDEFYQTDLIGLEAITPEGVSLGRVKAVHDYGAGDILELDPGGGRTSQFLPFTRATVPEIDLAKGRLTAVPPTTVTAEPGMDAQTPQAE
ncbi:ribosome maturation factor RimM [Caulobacter sp. S45]|uniref:ribosome maturation factor RimM n=1 Tax=Caulobacter sp. S45 TaxID=1641861 RepID=UPI00131B24EE|nr:ribosome maturation factor RimM [Caulobacter sp. S45]